MRKRYGVWLWLLVFGAICSAAQRGGDGSPEDQFLGTWSGSWDGAGTGGFELTLERGKDGAMSGKVSVTGDPTYKAAFKTVSFDGKQMSAKYDFPPDEGAEVLLTASFDTNSAKGTWILREKSNGNEIANGNWTVSRK